MTNEGTTYLILDRIYGWNEAAPKNISEGLATTADGDRRLFAFPGRSSLLLDSNTQEKDFVCPNGLAVSPQGRIGVVDAELNRVIIIDWRRQKIETTNAIGGKGTSPRNFSAPRGIAILKSGDVVIADTGNHRVQTFSAIQGALVQLWGASDADGNPIAGDGEKTFQRPWSVAADECGNVFVVDRGNQRLQKISQHGTWLGEIGGACLIDPIRMALGPHDLIAVVDAAQDAVLLFSPRRIFPRSLTNIREPRSVAFDSDGMLYVGDASGLIHLYSPAANETDGYELIGQGSSNVDGELLDLAWVPGPNPFLAAIIKENYNGLRRRLWKIEPIGTFKHEGQLVTRPLDSGMEKCQWHRILMSATMPARESQKSQSTNLGAGSIEIESYTSDSREVEVSELPKISWRRCVLTGDDDPDCLVQSGPGRYLWLRLTLRSNGIVSPVIHRIKAFYPRLSYLHYLPAVYQEDEDSRVFLDRFLSIFQTEFENFDRKIDETWRLFDPASVSESHFPWLASWLGLVIQPDSLVDQRCRVECITDHDCQPPPECPTDSENLAFAETSPLVEISSKEKRRLLEEAVAGYRVRGTVSGVEQAIQDHTGVQFARILEHFRLRRWPVLSVIAEPPATDPCVAQPPPKKGACGENLETYKTSLRLDGSVRLWSRDFYKRLQLTTYSQLGYFRLIGAPEPALEPFDWGAHRFTVFFPASPYNVAETKKKVQQVVEREKPAHTHAELCPVLPRLRVGVQATVGADAVVGGISHLVLNSLSTLNYDAILSCSEEEKRLRGRGTSGLLRTGVTTKVS